MFFLNNLKKIEIKSISKFNEYSSPKKAQFNGELLTYELLYRISGDNETFFAGKKIFNTAGTLEYLPKGIQNKNYHAHILNPGECIDIFFDTNDIIPDTPSFINLNNRDIEDTILKMEKIWRKKEPGYYYKSVSLFYQMLYNLEIAQTSYLTQKQHNQIQPAIDYIHENFANGKIAISLLPEMCSMSYSYFKKIFFGKFNMSASQYINKLRMEHAKELLIHQHNNTTKTSQALGFENVYYFSKVFKDYYGMSPSAYKNQNKK